ncbi:MAG TPA: hypothetical protein VL943_04295, partial [Niabella sp.]|nr:hypothetical protein [Niabella sp.]
MQQEEKEKQSMLQKAINIATHEFRDKVDKQGMPYILHLFRVMFKVAKHGQEFMQIALLHDLLEDCPDWTMDRLISEGFSPIVVVTISRLTHVGGIDYQKYIESIYENPVATIVKGADLE